MGEGRVESSERVFGRGFWRARDNEGDFAANAVTGAVSEVGEGAAPGFFEVLGELTAEGRAAIGRAVGGKVGEGSMNSVGRFIQDGRERIVSDGGKGHATVGAFAGNEADEAKTVGGEA